MITKIADKMAAAYQFAFVDNLPLSFITRLPPNFIYGLLYQTLGLSHNQDGRQNGLHLSAYTCGHSNLVIYHPISS